MGCYWYENWERALGCPNELTNDAAAHHYQLIWHSESVKSSIILNLTPSARILHPEMVGGAGRLPGPALKVTLAVSALLLLPHRSLVCVHALLFCSPSCRMVQSQCPQTCGAAASGSGRGKGSSCSEYPEQAQPWRQKTWTRIPSAGCSLLRTAGAEQLQLLLPGSSGKG